MDSKNNDRLLCTIIFFIFHAFALVVFAPCMSIFVVEQVVLPEGSKDIEVSAPFPTQQWQEVISHCMV